MDAILDAAKQFDELNTDETKEAVSGYRKDIEKYLELVTIRTKMESKMKEGVDQEVSDEEAAQKAMRYVYFSFTSTDDEGNAVDMTDDEKEALRADAKNLADRVSAGEDMAAVAEEMGQESTDATFDEEDTAPNEELIAAVNAFTTEGECTEPIESEGGIYVAQLTSLLDREATDQEKSNIIADRQQEQYDSLLEEWRNATTIEVDEKVWDKVDFNEVGVTIVTPEEETGDSGSTSDDSGTAAEIQRNKEQTAVGKSIIKEQCKSCIAPFLTAACNLNIFTFLKIVHQDVRTVLYAEFGCVKDHMIIVDITPCPAGVFIIICCTLLIVCLDFFLCLVIA